jgi:hypothetical protein
MTPTADMPLRLDCLQLPYPDLTQQTSVSVLLSPFSIKFTMGRSSDISSHLLVRLAEFPDSNIMFRKRSDKAASGGLRGSPPRSSRFQPSTDCWRRLLNASFAWCLLFFPTTTTKTTITTTTKCLQDEVESN